MERRVILQRSDGSIVTGINRESTSGLDGDFVPDKNVELRLGTLDDSEIIEVDPDNCKIKLVGLPKNGYQEVIVEFEDHRMQAFMCTTVE